MSFDNKPYRIQKSGLEVSYVKTPLFEKISLRFLKKWFLLCGLYLIITLILKILNTEIYPQIVSDQNDNLALLFPLKNNFDCVETSYVLISL